MLHPDDAALFEREDDRFLEERLCDGFAFFQVFAESALRPFKGFAVDDAEAVVSGDGGRDGGADGVQDLLGGPGEFDDGFHEVFFGFSGSDLQEHRVQQPLLEKRQKLADVLGLAAQFDSLEVIFVEHQDFMGVRA